MFRLTSDVVAPHERLEFWLDCMQQNVSPFWGEPAGDTPFRGDIAMQMIGDLPVATIDGAGYRSARRRLEIARSPDHFYAVAVQVGGETSLTNQGEEKRLRRGDVFVLDTMHEFAFGFHEPYRHLFVRVPKEAMEARVPRPDLLCGSVLPHEDPMAQLFAGYLAAGFQTADRLSPSATTMFTQHLFDLLAEAFAEPQQGLPAPSTAMNAAMFARARRLIAINCSDPNLTPDRIAGDLAISTRTLQRLFAEHGTTVMKHVFEERLDLAAKLLRSPQARARSVTDIAFACGFNNVTHFGRVFAERMGAPPSAWRKQMG